MLALTHVPSVNLQQCELTHVARASIVYEAAIRQHADYCRMLRQCGAEVHTLDINREHPDSVFIEDTAVVLDEVAILASMGAPSRRAEPLGIEPELHKWREVEHIRLPAVLEGGDVLRVGRLLLVGISSRTSLEGASELRRIVRRYGYGVFLMPVQDCLHLKTACTALPDGSLLVNPQWLQARLLRDFSLVPIPAEEPWGANVALVGDSVCLSATHVRTADLLRRRGYDVQTVDLSEFAKAEGGVTCLSILLEP